MEEELKTSAQGDGDAGNEAPKGEPTEIAEAPATTGEADETDEVAQTN